MLLNANVIERYFEFEAAPTGEWLDVAIHWTPEKRESDWEFQSHMTTAAHIERDRVTVAMRIPGTIGFTSRNVVNAGASICFVVWDWILGVDI